MKSPHAVILATVSLIEVVMKQYGRRDDFLENYRKFLPQLVKIMKQVLGTSFSCQGENEISGICDPFL